eukprot:scaffold10690_cov126-Cylindrotheca_fusiformis.AAC.5
MSETTSDDRIGTKEEKKFSNFSPPMSGLDVNESDFNEIDVKELASKVSEIALDEREAALFDMHGVAPTLEEDPEMLSTSLTEMNKMLTNMLCWRQASAFKIAESQAPEYTRNEKLLLMFLRCENFNVKAAANRLIAFFRHKLSLFGPEKLTKETIGQSDLDEEDLKCIAAGYVQLLPNRDHAGRAQFIYFPRFVKWATRDNALRMFYYLCMVALRDEETQRKGIVSLVHSVGNDGSNPQEKDSLLAWKSMQLMRGALPMKVVGHHVCSSPSSGLRFFFSYVTKFIGSAGIARTRFHEGMNEVIYTSVFCCDSQLTLSSEWRYPTGTFEEIEQELSGFGINGVNLAISYEGDLKTDRHKRMLRSLKCLEAQTSSTEAYVVLPSQTDVLLGRGKPIQNHPGNIRLSLIVESLLPKYDGCLQKREKTQLAAETVDRMKGAGVRFLSKCDECWKVAPDRIARERVRSTFRTVRDRLKMEGMALLDSRLRDGDIHARQKKRILEER